MNSPPSSIVTFPAKLLCCLGCLLLGWVVKVNQEVTLTKKTSLLLCSEIRMYLVWIGLGVFVLIRAPTTLSGSRCSSISRTSGTRRMWLHGWLASTRGRLCVHVGRRKGGSGDTCRVGGRDGAGWSHFCKEDWKEVEEEEGENGRGRREEKEIWAP